MSSPPFTLEVLQSGLAAVLASPKDNGVLEYIVSRPGVGRREVRDEAMLDDAFGLVGDHWIHRGSSHTPDGRAHPDMQVTIMNSRLIALVAGSKDRWELAGDQLFVDLDLGCENLPPGSRLAIGGAEIEVTAQPHTGCAKFLERFGQDALHLVNSAEGRQLRLRGANGRVVGSGLIRVGDRVTKIR
jgi:MOSC domain-containing protein YiiM